MKNKCLILSVFLVVLFSMVCAAYSQDDSRMPGNSMVNLDRVEALKVIQARNENRVLEIPGVVGIGIGLAEDGKDLAFIVYVEKLTSAVRAQAPVHIEGVPIRMIESGVFKAY